MKLRLLRIKPYVKGKIHYTSFPLSKSTTSLQQIGAGESPLCLLCRVISQIPLQRLAADL